ncbi:MAG: DUF1992 domain-containing protein [Planctomycetaceae bacterium]|nr:DUF1992 domain-containing protein [Planctomycetaceae bacterium]
MKFTERLIQQVADAKIEEAIRDGAFDQLSGFGQPFTFDEMSYDPHWWIRQKLKREELQLQLDERQMSQSRAHNGGSPPTK